MNDIDRACAAFRTLLEEQQARVAGMTAEQVDYTNKATVTIGLVDGDGIGPIIMEQAVRALEALLAGEIARGSIALRRIRGLTLENRMACDQAVPDDVLAEILTCDVLLKGPTTTPMGGGLESANVKLRRALDLYANVRPVVIPDEGIDWTFFRENTEGEYALGSRGVELPGMAVDFKVTTDPGTRRIARAAFDYARRSGKTRVTVVTKANILKKTDGKFTAICHEVAAGYPEITVDDYYIDIMAANLVNERVRGGFQVLLLPNLYGDIITDEAAQSLACVDAIDGEYTGKRRFLIFDYCGNFEFFRQKPNGYESTDTKSLSESIFCKQVRIAAALQDGAYTDEKYQCWRNILTETCRAEVGALNPELVSVRLHRKAVEHYQKPEAFTALSETDKDTLMREVAPLISLDDKDEAAKRFDNFVYGLVLCELEGLPGLTRAQRQLKNTAALLEQKATIPQVQAKLPLIREVQTDEFLTSHDLLRFEEMRQELRELIKFLVEGGEGQKPIYTALADPVLEQSEGKTLDSGYDFGEYRERVNRYIMEHRSDTLAIHKLTQNIPLSQGDYTELEHIFTSELGSKEDYAREFKDTPFGLLVRKVAKLDHEAAMQAFSKFINDESLNAKQIAFVQKVIHYIEQNGYVESKAVLMKPPFDQPILFTRLFDGKMGGELMETINSVKENATHVTA